jgi:hypothetical protein
MANLLAQQVNFNCWSLPVNVLCDVRGFHLMTLAGNKK